MRSNRRRDTSPEVAVRSMLHRSGLRFRVDVPLGFDRRRRADIVFPRARVAIFIDGCFWHGCPEHYSAPATNIDYWADKVEGNRARDRDTVRRLHESGWQALRYWEHEKPNEVVADITLRLSHGTSRLSEDELPRAPGDLRHEEG